MDAHVAVKTGCDIQKEARRSMSNIPIPDELSWSNTSNLLSTWLIGELEIGKGSFTCAYCSAVGLWGGILRGEET